MAEDKKAVKPEVKKETLTNEELKVLVNVLANATTTVQNAPGLINLANKISRIVDQK